MTYICQRHEPHNAELHSWTCGASMTQLCIVYGAKFAKQTFQDVILSHICFLLKYQKQIRDNGWGTEFATT